MFVNNYNQLLMNLFCCEEMCDEPNQEEIYEPRHSNYKLNTYSSQSTDSQNQSVRIPVYNYPLSKKAAESPTKLIRPVLHQTRSSPQKYSYCKSTLS